MSVLQCTGSFSGYREEVSFHYSMEAIVVVVEAMKG